MTSDHAIADTNRYQYKKGRFERGVLFGCLKKKQKTRTLQWINGKIIMSWLYELQIIPSEKNGRIFMVRRFGWRKILVNGYDETSHYMTSVLKYLLQPIPREAIFRRILLLGLGGGGIVPYLLRQYSTAHITIVEWDPRMVELAKKIGNLPSPHRWTIQQGDAFEIVPTLNEKYDLVIFDLFKGKHIVPSLLTEPFIASLSSILAPGGYLCINAFSQPEFLDAVSTHLSPMKRWKKWYNNLGIFRHKNSENLISALPDGYRSHRNCKEYLDRDSSNRKNFSVVLSNGSCGLRWHHGFMHFEKYFGDAEPIVDPTGPKRMVMWQRERRFDVPSGWKYPWVNMDLMMYGFSDRGTDEVYWKRWSEHAQRQRKKWLAQNEWELFEPDPEEFYKAYRKAKKDILLKTMMIDYVRKFAKRHGSLVYFIAARRKKPDAPIEAGFAFLDIPEVQQSLHLASYILESAKDSSAGTGMMDYWFETAKERGIRFLDFGVYRQKGEPRSWRGFTRFKGQFDIHYMKYPKPLVRWTGSFKELLKKNKP